MSSQAFIGPVHPCYIDGDWDHDWEFVDASFDHEYGTEQVYFDRCCHCDEESVSEHGQFDELYFNVEREA